MTEQDHGAGREIDQPVALHGLLVDLQRGPRGVECDLPASVIKLVRYPESDRLMMRIHEQKKIRVLGALSLSVPNLGCSPVHEHAERAHPAAVFPVLALHALAVRAEPDDVLVRMLGVRIVVIERAAVKVWVLLAVLDHPLREPEELLFGGIQVPVIPGQLIILAVTVVVALLGARELIAAADHGTSLRE